MDPNNDFDKVWKQIIYETLDDNSDKQIMSYLRAMQQQGGNNSQHIRPRRVINRNREDEHSVYTKDLEESLITISKNLVYKETQFRRRFRMRRQLFMRIVNALSNYNGYFQMRPDDIGRMGLSSLQKCTTAIRILAYESPADCVDEYIRIGECTTTQWLQFFLRGVNEIFGQEYLRRPNNNDINCLLQIGDAQKFPGYVRFY
ncbi:hypothetical protein JHK87_047205 [Glycine soja]|nr:hypothetical protein JHK87_047205 [Glycine soja]